MKAAINQVGAPAIFWTLSWTEFHWPEFYSFFSDDELSKPETLCKKVINNPHLLDCLFTVRVEKFVKHWLYEEMGAIWYWYWLEYALMRDCHGLAKQRDDPGLSKISEVALNGHNAQQMLSSNNFELRQFDNLERAVHKGKIAEDEIYNYVNSFVTGENPSPPCECG